MNEVTRTGLRAPHKNTSTTNLHVFFFTLILLLVILQQLPENSAIVTQLRNPVNRVISAYEFAIEVAARRIHMPDNDFTNQQANRTFVNTLNVWPWSYLVPSFRRDMRLHVSVLVWLFRSFFSGISAFRVYRTLHSLSSSRLKDSREKKMNHPPTTQPTIPFSCYLAAFSAACPGCGGGTEAHLGRVS